jgi:hypothetical protein
MAFTTRDPRRSTRSTEQEVDTAQRLVEQKLASTRGRPPETRAGQAAGMLAGKGHPGLAFRPDRDAGEEKRRRAGRDGRRPVLDRRQTLPSPQMSAFDPIQPVSQMRRQDIARPRNGLPSLQHRQYPARLAWKPAHAVGAPMAFRPYIPQGYRASAEAGTSGQLKLILGGRRVARPQPLALLRSWDIPVTSDS